MRKKPARAPIRKRAVTFLADADVVSLSRVQDTRARPSAVVRAINNIAVDLLFGAAKQLPPLRGRPEIASLTRTLFVEPPVLPMAPPPNVCSGFETDRAKSPGRSSLCGEMRPESPQQ